MAGITAPYTRSLQGPGLTFSLSSTLSSPLATPWSVEVSAAKTGTLTTRSSGTAGTLTMSGGHGFTDGQRLDIYWSTGSCRGATIGTVATNSVPFTGASGDALPSADTAITAIVPTSEPIVFTGDNAVALAASCPVGGTVVFAASNNSEIYAKVLTSTVTTWTWVSADGGTNPVASGSVAKVFLSHGSSTAASTLTGLTMYS